MKSKILSFILTIALVVAGAFANVNIGDKTEMVNSAEEATELKEYTVTSKQLTEIAQISVEDGKKAAEIINEYDGNDFEAGVNKVLTKYYSEENYSELKDFTDNIDIKADVIVEGYAEAAEERANADKLKYEAGTSLLTFGADITEQEIKDIVKDQYGECEYIYEYVDGTYLVKVKNSLGLTVEKAVDAYDEYVETMQVARNDKVEQIAEAYQLVNDTYAANQYYLRTMQAVDAWQYIRGVNHSKIKVAVVDGGADLNSADLQASSDLSAEILSNNTYIPLRQSSSMYNNAHGTTVAGVLAGTANNGTQIAGVASCINNDVAELINIKIEMYVDKIAVGVDYARQVGAKVVNLSLAHDGANSVEEAAINNFVAAGGTVVAGAGNSATDAATYPSDYENAISVISVDEGYNIAGSSNRGWAKDICAPGVSIYAPNITGQAYDTVVTGGTSLASPMVAAVVTMMYSVNPGINSGRVREILINTAKDLGDPGRDWTYAYGFVNAYAAVVQAAGGTTVETTTQAPSDGLQECTRNANTYPSYWGYYVGDWAGASARYSAGSGWDPMTLKITANGGSPWGVQLFTAQVVATPGTKYNVNITLNSDRAGASVLFKENTTDTTLEQKTLVAGDNTFSGTFTATGDTVEFFFDLGAVQAGTTIKTVSIGMSEVAPETTTTQAPSDGMNECIKNENTLVGDWGYYVGDWAGASARYLGGTSLNDFTLKVTANGGAAWGVQAFTKNIGVNPGSKYTVKVTLNSSAAGASVLFKENVSDTSFETKTLVAGDNVFTGTYTPSGNEAAFYFDLGAVAAGTTVKVTSFSLTEEKVETTAAETTVAETTTPETVVTDWQEVYNSNGVFEYRNATNVEVVNIQQPGFASEQGIYMSTSEAIGSIKINDVTAGDDAVAIQGAGAVVYLTAFNEGISSISLYSPTGAFLGSVQIRRNAEEVTTTEVPTEAPTEAPTEEPTEEPTTEAINRIEDGIEINGYQVSATVGGMRTVYSVDSEIDGKAVVSSGLIYSLTDLVGESEMYVGSTNAYVRNFASTAAGKSDTLFSDSDIATSYAMTMRFGAKTAAEYNTSWRVRAYAQLEDGTYVYSKSYTYKIYDIADALYQNKKMNTKEHHEYLYNDILKVVNKDYTAIDYDWNNAVVSAR